MTRNLQTGQDICRNTEGLNGKQNRENKSGQGPAPPAEVVAIVSRWAELLTDRATRYVQGQGVPNVRELQP